MAAEADFRPALVIVDVQEDFCPPNGSLAVPQGRQVAPVINRLLQSPAFALRVATKDWHPSDHISFASNHPDGDKKPFIDSVTITNPEGGEDSSSHSSLLWPVHCVQNTPGAELIPELDTSRLDVILEKGTDPRFEMYSPFYSPFFTTSSTSTSTSTTTGGGRRRRVGDTGLADLLRKKRITDVYVVGLAADYCVGAAAVDSAAEGFRTFVVEEGTRAVDPEGWVVEGGGGGGGGGCSKEGLRGKGVEVVRLGSEEVAGRLGL